MKAGNRIDYYPWDSTVDCTMAFSIVWAGSQKQVLSAGHCAYALAGNWTHQGLPGNDVFGTKAGTLFVSEGRDIMRMTVNDQSQAGLRVYGAKNLSGA